MCLRSRVEGVSCLDGVWRYQDRFGRVTSSHEGPFRQAEAALHGVMDTLRANLPAHVQNRLATGYGVIFPDCDWLTYGAEWDPEMLCDRRRSRSLEDWLRRLFVYWQQRCENSEPLVGGTLSMVHEFLRPNVHAVDRARDNDVSLLNQVTDAEQRIKRLTGDQMRMADVAEANPRVLCEGGAGTGQNVPGRKTRSALDRIRHASGLDMPISVASPPSRVAASYTPPDSVADWQRPSRLPSNRAELLRCVDRRRRAGLVRDGVFGGAGRSPGWRTEDWPLVLVSGSQQPSVDRGGRQGRQGNFSTP